MVTSTVKEVPDTRRNIKKNTFETRRPEERSTYRRKQTHFIFKKELKSRYFITWPTLRFNYTNTTQIEINSSNL